MQGTIQIVTETGYSGNLADTIKQDLWPLITESNRYSGEELRIRSAIFVDVITRWDYYVDDTLRSTDAEIESLIEKIKGRSRGTEASTLLTI